MSESPTNASTEERTASGTAEARPATDTADAPPAPGAVQVPPSSAAEAAPASPPQAAPVAAPAPVAVHVEAKTLSAEQADALATNFRASWENDEGSDADRTLTEVPAISSVAAAHAVTPAPPVPSPPAEVAPFDDSGFHRVDVTGPVRLPTQNRSRNAMIGGLAAAVLVLGFVLFTLARSSHPASSATGSGTPTTVAPVTAAVENQVVQPPRPTAPSIRPIAAPAAAAMPIPAIARAAAPHAAPTRPTVDPAIAPPAPSVPSVVTPPVATAVAHAPAQVAAAAAPPAAVRPPAPPVPPPPALVRVHIVVDPTSADLRIDGHPVRPPYDVRVIQAPGPHVVDATASGFLPRHEIVAFDRDVSLALALTRVPPPVVHVAPPPVAHTVPMPPPHVAAAPQHHPAQHHEAPPPPHPAPAPSTSHGHHHAHRAGFVTDNPY